MAKKSKIKKSVKKPKIPESKAVPKEGEGLLVLGVLALAAWVIFGLVKLHEYGTAPEEFETEQCYIDRSYQPVMITEVYRFVE